MKAISEVMTLLEIGLTLGVIKPHKKGNREIIKLMDLNFKLF
jgi:hypothetical protein